MGATWDIILATVGQAGATHFAMATMKAERLETYCGVEGRTVERGSTRVYPSAATFVTCRRCIEAVRQGWVSHAGRWEEHARFIEEPTYD